MRRSWAVVLGGVLLVLYVLGPSVAVAEEAADPTGTYLGTVTGSSGNTYEAWAQVGKSRMGWVIVTVKAGGQPSFPIPARMTWTGPDSFTIKTGVWVPGLVSGSGSATWTKTGDEWAVTGQGSGSVMDGPEGSGTGQGARVSTEFTEPPLKAEPINEKKDEKGGGKDATGTAGAGAAGTGTGDAVASALVAAGAMGESPRVSDGGKAEAALSADVAVLAGVLLCIFLGATMSGAEFVELWTAPEGSES